jgi:hypothetical protein
MVVDNIDGFDDVGMLESRAYTELCGDLFLVLLLGLAGAFCTELLDSVDMTAILSLYETNDTTCPAAENPAPLSILLCDVGMGGLVERVYGVVASVSRGSGL